MLIMLFFVFVFVFVFVIFINYRFLQFITTFLKFLLAFGFYFISETRSRI